MTGARTRCAVVLAVFLAGCAGPSQSVTRGPEVSPPGPAAAPAEAPPSPPRADPLARVAAELAELQNAVAKLMMSARQHDDQLLYLQRRLTEMESQARGRAAGVPGFAPSTPSPLPPPAVATLPPLPSVAPAPAGPPPPAAGRPTPPAVLSPADELYEAGFAKYRAGDLEGAMLTLYEVVAVHPGDPARERAQLLIAEILYAQKEYRGAVAELEAFIRAVPKGTRVPEALLKLGLAQRALGEDGRARRVWERLVKEHPGSAAAREARTLLRGARG